MFWIGLIAILLSTAAAVVLDWRIGLAAAIVSGVAWYSGHIKGKANDRDDARREADASAKIAELETRAARAEAANRELEIRLAWRSIEPGIDSLIRARLAQFAGQKVVVFAFQKDAESLNLAQQLSASLNRAGVCASVLQTDLPTKPRIGGLQIDVGENRRELGQALIEILFTAKTVGKVTRGVSQTADWVEIAVWAKNPDE